MNQRCGRGEQGESDQFAGDVSERQAPPASKEILECIRHHPANFMPHWGALRIGELRNRRPPVLGSTPYFEQHESFLPKANHHTRMIAPTSGGISALRSRSEGRLGSHHLDVAGPLIISVLAANEPFIPEAVCWGPFRVWRRNVRAFVLPAPRTCRPLWPSRFPPLHRRKRHWRRCSA